MFSKYIEVIESFKDHQLSKLTEKIHSKIIEILNSPKFNSRIMPYFQTINDIGEPFTDFNRDPDTISQIKKVINALYHARLTFLDLEQADLRNSERTLSDLSLLYNRTIHEAYQASYLLTHLDVDIKEMFHEELALIFPYIAQFDNLAKKNSAKTQEIAQQLKDFPFSYKTGEVSGIVIEQMQPNSGDLDYNFLTQFGVDLPGHIDKITQYISQYSSHIIETPSLDKEKIEELQHAAFKLLNDLEKLKGSSLFFLFKILHYLSIITHIITLSMSSLEQVGHLTESSQNVIRDNIAKLKYSVLPTLFGLIDKIEGHALFKPGTLSIPLMDKIKPLYDLLIYYASKPINLQAKGEELCSIEDSSFLSLRFKHTYQRIDAANKALFKIKKVQEAYTAFYLLLEDPEYKDLALHQLPQDIKIKLIRQYKLIMPYMKLLDPDFNELITTTLLGKEGWFSFLSRSWHWVKKKLTADHISFILNKKEDLQNSISKKKATQEFHIDLSRDIIESVQKQANIVLFPYSQKENTYFIDESSILNSTSDTKSELEFTTETEHKLLLNPEKLTADQSLDLYQWYGNRHNQFTVARKAYLELISLLNSHEAIRGDVLHIDKLSDEVKTRFRDLYILVQPYFIDGIPSKLRAAALNFDISLVHSLSNNVKKNKAPIVNLFLRMDEYLQKYFTQIDSHWNTQSLSYLQWAEDKFESENEEIPLIHEKNSENRTHYLIPHTHYSKFIKEFRRTLSQITAAFNKPMQEELTPKRYGIPFPELQDKNQTLAQSKQVLAIKRIFNTLYHLEGIILELERLTNKQYESIYVYHLFVAYGHIHNILQLTQNLAHDPHFELLGRQLLEKAQTALATIQEHSDVYQMESKTSTDDDESIQHKGLWYVLHTFFIFPKHLRAINNKKYLTAEELNQLHTDAKNSTLRIEKIIKNSNSYFKLFLQTPNMYRLYKALSNKLNEFMSTSHDTMIDNLDKLRSEFITPMLLEADLWEDQLGLKPGILTHPLKSMTDEYYKGLLHPLGLHSKKHIELICDKDPFTKRIEKTHKKIESAKARLKKLENNYRHLDHLYTLLQQAENSIDGLTDQNPKFNKLRTNLGAAYKKALPKLVKLEKKLKLAPGTTTESYKLDAFFNQTIGQYDPKLNQIQELIFTSHHYYLGIKSTCQMQLNNATEKLNYLTHAQPIEEEANLQFIEDYTTESFNKQLDALSNRHIGLQYTDKEYSRKLKENLLTHAQEIIKQAKTAADINLSVRTLLKIKIGLFEKEFFSQYYHLDTVRVALAQFKNYFSLSNANNSLYENELTIEKKSEYINKCVEMAEDEQSSIDKRLDRIKFHVAKDPNFERIILAYKPMDYFSLAYLRWCFFALLEALYLYIPTRKTLYQSLSYAVNNKPEIIELTQRFGLFATPKVPLPKEASVEHSPSQPALTLTEQDNIRSTKTLEEESSTNTCKNMLVFIQQENQPSHQKESSLLSFS